MYKKCLACALILLFISVSFQPVFAIDNKSSIDNTENVNDCSCEVVSDVQRIKFEKLLNRLEFHTKRLSLLFKNNPKIVEKCKELFKSISILKVLNDWPILLCIILFIHLGLLAERYDALIIIFDYNLPFPINLWANLMWGRICFIIGLINYYCPLKFYSI